MKVTLARALQVQKRLAEQIARVSSNIREQNRLADENKRTIDVEAEMQRRDNLIERLINLKMKIFEAGMPIRKQLLALAEMKSTSAFLQSLDTSEGTEFRNVLTSRDIKYNVIITKAVVEERVAEIELAIDLLQYNVIDVHNNSTFIDIEWME